MTEQPPHHVLCTSNTVCMCVHDAKNTKAAMPRERETAGDRLPQTQQFNAVYRRATHIPARILSLLSTIAAKSSPVSTGFTKSFNARRAIVYE